ncbi:MAG: hypothetical protein JST08_18760 [Actinobacteria bacterium]|nr:hypothetical protein [Actinomycetota bacterium]
MSGIGRLKRRAGGGLGVLATAIAVLAGPAGPAAAATPIDLGPAEEGPHLALNAAGDGVMTFSDNNSLAYCKLAAGAGACGPRPAFIPPVGFIGDLGNWPLISGSSELLVESRRDGAFNERKYVYEGPADLTPTVVANDETQPGTSLDFTEAVLAPAGSINTTAMAVTVTGGALTYGARLAASPLTFNGGLGTEFVFSRNAANTTNDMSADAAVAMQGSMLSVAYVDLSEDSHVYWRRLLGTGNQAFIQNNANWSAPAFVGTSSPGGPIRMASGPHGLFVAYPRSTDGAIVVQQFNGFNGFEAPVVVSPPNAVRFGIYEDSAGLIHVAYVNPEDGILHYTYAKDGSNQTFSNPQSLVTGDLRDLRTAVNANGQGWATWRDGENGHGFALELQPGEPLPPPPTPQTPGNSGGGGSNGVGTKKPPTKSPTMPTATTSTSLGHGLTGQLSVPKACVKSGEGFTAKLRVKRKGSQAHKVAYTVKRVKFLLGGKPILIDTKKPFEASFTTTGIKAGMAVPVTARVSVNLRFAHRQSTVTKSLSAKVRTCG